jgi:DNA-binding transcriptional LysR family regulator
VGGINPRGGIQLDQYVAIIRAVSAGLGIGLVPTCLIEDELARGEVVAPLAGAAGTHPAQAGYFLCYPENKASLEPLQALRDWLRAEVGTGDSQSMVEPG